jgi:hypothetical protein
LNKFNREDSNYHGGAVLADASCGSVTLYGAFGATLKVNVIDDPEYTMSGLYEPCGRSEGY